LFVLLLSRAAALRPPGHARQQKTATPFAPDTDALDDFFTQLNPDALATAPDEEHVAEWSESWDSTTVDGWGASTASAPSGEWSGLDAVDAAAPAFVPEGLGGAEWSALEGSWESLDDISAPHELVVEPADADAERALDVLATPRSATESAPAPVEAFSHPALSVGDAVEVLCEDNVIWYQATLTEVGLGIAIADYGSGFELEVVELKRIRVPAAPDVLDLLTVPAEHDKAYGEVDSHLLIERDANDRPAHAGYTYVDEQTCVGCYNCAMVAPSTFFMEDTYGGARVFHQHGDAAEIIEEAIDTCPVDCIHAVSFEQLQSLEIERRDQVINFAGRNMARAEGKNIMVASMTSGAGGRFSRVQEFEELAIEDEAFRRKAEEKAVERRQRARADVERISGVRSTSVEM